MYEVYVDGEQLPITPGKIQIKTGNQNKTMTLIDGSEINILKSPGLKEISFDALLPNSVYPFATSSSRDAAYYLQHFERLKSRRRRFPLIITRIAPSGELDDTNIRVAMEEIEPEEDAGKHGTDILVSLKFKQAPAYGTKTVVIQQQEGNTAIASLQSSSGQDIKEPPATYTVQPNDGFWIIAKKTLGDGGRMYDVAAYNGMTIQSVIHPGDVLNIPPK